MNFDSRNDPSSALSLPIALSAMEIAQLVRRLDESDPSTGSLLYLFKHALVQETVYTSLMRHDRKRLHRLVAEALERAYPEGGTELAPRLASHFDEAGDTERALHYYARAAKDAAARFANQEALEFYTHALGAAEGLQISTRDSLYRARGSILERIGEFDAARADLENALRIAQARRDSLAEWQSLLDLGYAWLARDYARAGELFEKALELVRETDDAARVAQTLNRVGNWYLNNEDAARALSYHHEALSLYQSLGDTRGIAETQDLLGMSSLIGSDFHGGIEHFQRAIDLYQTLGDRRGVAAASISMHLQNASLQSDTTVLPPAVGTPEDGMTQLLPLMQELGWRAGEAFVLWSVGEWYAAAGDYERGLALELQAMALAREIGHRQWLSAATLLYGAIHADLLDFATAQREQEKAFALARETGSQHWTRCAAGFLASTYIAQNELERAEQTLDAVAPASIPRKTLGQRQSWMARVELAMARHEYERALEMLDNLVKDTPNLKPDTVIPRLWMLRAQALLQMERADDAEVVAQAARANLLARSQPRLLWRLEGVLSHIYRAQGRDAEAQRAANAAQDIVIRLASTVGQEVLRENFIRNATEMIRGAS